MIFNTVSAQHVLNAIESSDFKIIDIRSVDAYNGWPLQGEKRGGHIPTAKSLWSGWEKYIDWIEIVKSKGIFTHHKIIIYSYSAELSEKTAERFHRAGYENIFIYKEFLAEWVNELSYPLKKLKRYKQLVSPQWLKQLIDADRTPEFECNSYVVCHAHYRNPDAYNIGHIPTAVELDTNWLESPETWNRRSPVEIKSVLEKLGISHDTTVILYGRFAFPKNEDDFPGSSAGHLGAMRMAFIMLYAGVKDVKILNGGLQAWEDAGFKTTTAYYAPKAIDDFGVNIPQYPEYAVDTLEAKEMISAADKNLVCVRSLPEYLGEVSGYNYIIKKGRIPGNVFGNCGSDAYHMENYRNLDHSMREYQEVEEIWRFAGITPDKHNAFYCGTGWRGSEAFINAWLMGWPKVSVYDGGWFEWSSDPENPVESGGEVPETFSLPKQVY